MKQSPRPPIAPFPPTRARTRVQVGRRAGVLACGMCAAAGFWAAQVRAFSDPVAPARNADVVTSGPRPETSSPPSAVVPAEQETAAERREKTLSLLRSLDDADLRWAGALFTDLGRWLDSATDADFEEFVSLAPTVVHDMDRLANVIYPHVFEAWAARNGPVACTAYLRLCLRSPDLHGHLWDKLMRAWAAHGDPAEVLDHVWVLRDQLKIGAGSFSANGIVIRWHETNPAAAMGWIAQALQSTDQDEQTCAFDAGGEILAKLHETRSPAEVSAWIDSWPDAKTRGNLRAVAKMLRNQSRPEEALAWFGQADWRTMPGVLWEFVNRELGPALHREYVENPAVAAAWLDTQPERFQGDAARRLARVLAGEGRWREADRWVSTLKLSAPQLAGIYVELAREAAANNDLRAATAYAERSGRPAAEQSLSVLAGWLWNKPERAAFLLEELLDGAEAAYNGGGPMPAVFAPADPAETP